MQHRETCARAEDGSLAERELRTLLQALSEDQLLIELRGLDRATLLEIDRLFGIDEFEGEDADGSYIPCRCEELLDWLGDRGILVDEDEWDQFLRKPLSQRADLAKALVARHSPLAPRPSLQHDPFPCGCVKAFEPPPAITLRPWYLPLDAQILVRELLDPESYREPPLPPRPSLVATTSTKATVMAARAAQGFALRRRGHDILDRETSLDFYETYDRKVRRGANGHAITGELNLRSA